MYKEGDKLILHSSNGHDYEITIENVNEYRPPEAVYACEMYDDEGHDCTPDDYFFCSEEWLNTYCVRAEEDN